MESLGRKPNMKTKKKNITDDAYTLKSISESKLGDKVGWVCKQVPVVETPCTILKMIGYINKYNFYLRLRVRKHRRNKLAHKVSVAETQQTIRIDIELKWGQNLSEGSVRTPDKWYDGTLLFNL